MISRAEVKHVAELAALSLEDAEVDALTRDLESIVAYVDELATVDTEGVAAFTHHATTPLRADVIEPGLTREAALSQAPRATDDGFVVPKFVESSRGGA